MNDEAGVVQQFRDHRLVFTPVSVVKEATSPSYAERLDDERSWYRYLIGNGFPNIPRVLRWHPFEIERIRGVPLHHLTGLSNSERQSIFTELLATVARLHSVEHRPTSAEDLHRAYVTDPVEHAEEVARALGSGWPRPRSVNGHAVHDLDFPTVRARLRALGESIEPPSRFVPVHGDLSFSNLLWDRTRRRVVLLSPRGRFGRSLVFGDALIDWAELLFAVRENADALAEGSFRLDRDANDARVRAGSAGWEHLSGHLRATAAPRGTDLLRLQPILCLRLAVNLARRPSSLEAAYLTFLELLARPDE